MDKIFSTRMDEAVVRNLDSLAKALGRSKKRIVEDAISLYSKTLEHRPDPIEHAFGAWQRSESAEDLRRQMRAVFGDSMRRNRKPPVATDDR